MQRSIRPRFFVVGRVGGVGRIGEVGRVGWIGEVGRVGMVGEVGKIGRIGEVGEVKEVGKIEKTGYQAGNVEPSSLLLVIHSYFLAHRQTVVRGRLVMF